MRNICPKVNLYNGPIYGKGGEQCITSSDLDEAMLATREFWFQVPETDNNAWQPVLDCYASRDPWPLLLHTKDSAPGPDGLPYSAWRMLSQVTVDVLLGTFMILSMALHCHQCKLVSGSPRPKLVRRLTIFGPLVCRTLLTASSMEVLPPMSCNKRRT